MVQGELEEHPELGLRVRRGIQMPQADLIRFSDQASYLERGVPVLFFNSGMHAELHSPDDEFSLTDTNKLARAAHLVFYTALAVANDPDDPIWTEEGRARRDGMAKKIRRYAPSEDFGSEDAAHQLVNVGPATPPDRVVHLV